VAGLVGDLQLPVKPEVPSTRGQTIDRDFPGSQAKSGFPGENATIFLWKTNKQRQAGHCDQPGVILYVTI
jgi:hypothetical protein